VTVSSLVALSRRLDAPSRLIGRWFRWLAVALVLVQLVVVVARYVFAYSNPMLQEAVLYTNATLFMACAGYAYWIDAHVRVDITYFSASARSRAVTNPIVVRKTKNTSMLPDAIPSHFAQTTLPAIHPHNRR